MRYLARALKLASQTHPHPNPKVGCVIIKNGKIIGQGYHKKAGEDHAEIMALKSCRIKPEGAAMYVTLEPCCHHGKTPPCTDAIINAGIKKVVCCTKDPNPKVSGQGFKILKKHGIAVQSGFLRKEAEKLNEHFFYYKKNNLPFVAVKVATSLDGKIAAKSGDSKWITNKEARNYARKLRGQYQAILVGINTVLKDNPHLGTRHKNLPDPIRIILDPQLKISVNAEVLRDNNVIIATTEKANHKKKKILRKKSITIWQFPFKNIPPKKLLKKMADHNIISVLVEGGGETIGRFFDAKIVNKVYWFQAPVIIGGKQALPAVGGQGIAQIKKAFRLKNVERRDFGEDNLKIGYL